MKIEGQLTPEWGVVDVICDRCQKSVRVNAAGLDDVSYFGTLSISGGYHSPCLPDGMVTEAHLCEACWIEARKALEKIGVKFIDTNYL